MSCQLLQQLLTICCNYQLFLSKVKVSLRRCTAFSQSGLSSFVFSKFTDVIYIALYFFPSISNNTSVLFSLVLVELIFVQFLLWKCIFFLTFCLSCSTWFKPLFPLLFQKYQLIMLPAPSCIKFKFRCILPLFSPLISVLCPTALDYQCFLPSDVLHWVRCFHFSSDRHSFSCIVPSANM